MLLGCIADDVTGASDLAALLARSGLAVELHLGLPQQPDSGAPLQVIALKCRTMPAQAAVAECRAALAWLRAAGAQRFYWKYCSTFDSTPVGNIGPVAEALMRDLGVGQTLYCPAFPENGRAIFMGNLFVGDEPLAESPMKDHPLTPMRDSNLLRLLAPQVQGKVGLANRLVVARGAAALAGRLAELRADGVAHVVVDAVANEDLVVIAEAARDMALITGGSALALHLPALYRAARLAGEEGGVMPLPRTAPASIVLAGSCSAMTLAQVSTYLPFAAHYRLDPLALARDWLAPAAAWLADQPAERPKMIYSTTTPAEVRAVQDKMGAQEAGQLVEAALAALAVQARAQGVGRFVVAGGETSGAVVQALAIHRLTIGREIAPGVPWTYGVDARGPLALALKSGNFGAPGFFAEALALLDQA